MDTNILSTSAVLNEMLPTHHMYVFKLYGNLFHPNNQTYALAYLGPGTGGQKYEIRQFAIYQCEIRP
jgi:hypothetical protein